MGQSSTPKVLIHRTKLPKHPRIAAVLTDWHISFFTFRSKPARKCVCFAAYSLLYIGKRLKVVPGFSCSGIDIKNKFELDASFGVIMCNNVY